MYRLNNGDSSISHIEDGFRFGGYFPKLVGINTSVILESETLSIFYTSNNIF